MATKQFVSESPYINRDERKHHSSDLKYQSFLDTTGDRFKSKRVVNMALIGLGRAGSIHLSNLVAHSHINLCYVVDCDKFKLEKVNTLCGRTIKAVHPDDIDQILVDKELHACLIATPTFTHKDLILQCLEAGKAVFSEKPIGETSEETAECYLKSKEVGKPLFCGFQRRWDPSFSSIQSKVRNGDIGHIQIIKSISRDSPLPSIDYLKISGGIFHDCMVHDIDMITWVLGELPCQVHTMANAQIPEIAALGDYDNVVTSIKFSSGTLGIINVNRFAIYGYDQRLEVFGMKGMLEANNPRPNEAVCSTSVGAERVPIMFSFPSRYVESYAAELDSFVDVVNGDKELPITSLNTSAVSKIASAAERSARTGLPVDISWGPEEIPSGYFV